MLRRHQGELAGVTPLGYNKVGVWNEGKEEDWEHRNSCSTGKISADSEHMQLNHTALKNTPGTGSVGRLKR